MTKSTPYIPVTPVTIDIIVNLHAFFGDMRKVTRWLLTRNPGLGGLTPIEMIHAGSAKKLRNWILINLDSNRPWSEL